MYPRDFPDRAPRARKLLVWLAAAVLFSALVYFREPAYFLSPRIWAEEGAVYIQAWLDQGGRGSFFQPHLGYYSLFPNLAVQIGMSVVGLERIPWVTTLMSLLAMLICLLAPLFLPSRYWNAAWKKALIVLFSLLAGPGEIWLNTITIQFYLGVFAVYLLLADTESVGGWRLILAVFMLALAALTGVTASILLPFFIYKYLQPRRQPVDLLFCLILAGGLLVQVLVFLYGPSQGAGESRLAVSSLRHFPKGFAYSLSYIVNAQWQGGWYRDVLQGVAAILLVRAGIHAARDTGGARPLLILAGYLSVVFVALSLGMGGGARYAYVVAMLFVMMVIHQAGEARSGEGRPAILLLALLLLVKAPGYFSTHKYYDPEWPGYASEFALVKAGQQDFIRLFPRWQHADWRIQVRQPSGDKP